MSLGKAYQYLYYKLYIFGIKISDDMLNEYKPIITISVLENILIGESIVWYTVITGKTVSFSNPAVIFYPISLVIAAFNYYFFLDNKSWRKYINEFKAYDKQNKNIGSLLVFMIILLVISSLIISFYFLANRK
jgi:hypothetical protein